ncbi:ketopantoate reductase family protein [Roseomonas marmotae]|uniref:2-dehydropantoate 2-reductase n=1 Tax=Roseomonas marmotae TaxID=2768161 RepID=A0ABS3KAZ9_9PROT|nr:ketopantoate reductase family protein [Roseomonas marmotae]MBO1074653.1 ketopantoate reductase family protein [Roseomonas marmotae]QTI81673.1 ketopantoate reductase family protein [Roseomonas marmotae]
MSEDRLLIWGAGAIGGTLGAYLARAGEDVLLVDRAEDHVRAMNTNGLIIEGPVESFTQPVSAATPAEVRGRFRRVILAVKAQDTVEAVEALRPFLADDGYILSAQNGLNELAIAEAVGARRTLGCFVNFGADWLEPGRILFGNRAAVVVGEIDGQITDRARQMHALLRKFEPDAVLTDNIWGYLWGKLAYGSMLFATALTQASIADNFASARHVPVWRRLGNEVMAVARARGVTPVGFNGFDPSAFLPEAPEEASRQSIAQLSEFNRPSAKTHSGVWRDLAIRKRRTEVDAQIGIIARLGAEAGIDTPAIRKLVELIHDVEEGRRVQSWETLDALLAVCESAAPVVPA